MVRAFAFAMTLVVGSLGFAQESSATVFGRRCRPSCSRSCQPCVPAHCKAVCYSSCQGVEQRTGSPSSAENAANIAILRDEVDTLKAKVEALERGTSLAPAP